VVKKSSTTTSTGMLDLDLRALSEDSSRPKKTISPRPALTRAETTDSRSELATCAAMESSPD